MRSKRKIVYYPANESLVATSLEKYNSIKETEYIMKSKEMIDIIRNGDEEIKNSGGTSIVIEDLWK